MKLKRVLSTVLAFTTLIISTVSTVGTAYALEIETKDTPQASKSTVKSEASEDTLTDAEIEALKNRLCDNIEDGVILHAWCWSFNTIKENMAEIAKAGYTAVQTSPANACASDSSKIMRIMGNTADKKKGDTTSGYDGQLGAWWWHYQPTDFIIGNYQLGTETDYKNMCTEAHKYGIKIITDIVPNHTSSDKSQVSTNLINAVSDDGDINDLYHNESLRFGNITNYDSRRQCILRDMGGLPDINTENPKYQAYFLRYCNQLIDDGCDGFRLDTGKHIGVDSDPVDMSNEDCRNDFLDVIFGQKPIIDSNGSVIKDTNGTTSLTLHNRDNIFVYAEILEDKNIPYNEYAKYMNLVASNYGYTIRKAIGEEVAFSSSKLSSFGHSGNLSDDRLVTWVESHDTYCNDHVSAGLTDEQIRLAWAALAARKGGTPLFFSRPKNSTRENIWGDNKIGPCGNGEFNCDTVKAVNNFRNAMVGEDESLSNISDSKVLKIDRGTKGTCIINIDNSSRTLNDVKTTLAKGTYTDRVNGGTFTVSSDGKLSGEIAGRSVVVLYNTTNLKASPSEGEFTSDYIDVKLSFDELQEDSNANYTITVDGTASNPVDFNNNTTIHLGSEIEYNKEITLTLNAKDSNNIAVTKTYTYVKRNPNDVKYVYFDNNGFNWSSVTAWIYESGTTNYNASWPGKLMTYDSVTGYYKCEVPYNMENYKVVFYSSDKNRYPLYGSSGLLNTSNDMILKYDKTWKSYTSANDAADTSQLTEPDTYIYFFDSMGWSDYTINAYMWKGSDSSVVNNAAWPGEQMSWSEDLHCYYYAYNSSDGFENVIFNGKKILHISGGSDYEFTYKTNTLLPNAIKGKVVVPVESSQDNTHKEVTFSCSAIEPNNIHSHKVYYDNSTSKWSSVSVYTWGESGTAEQKNAVWPGEKATYVGNNIYSYTCYYSKTSTNDNFTSIIFKNDTVQTGDLTIPTDKKNPIYNYNPSGSSGSWSDVSSTNTSIPVYFRYIDNRVTTNGNSSSKQCVTKLTADTSTYNLDSAVVNALANAEDSNLYDEYECHATQFDYVKSLASTSDSRLSSGTTTYGTIYNPKILARSASVFSGIYNDNVETLSSSVLNNPKWVTYYDTNEKEIAYENILPDLSNLGYVDIRALSMPKTHGVTFYYPKESMANTELASFGGNKLYVAKDNSALNTKITNTAHKSNYNQTYRETAGDYSNLFDDMVKPTVDSTQCVFDGWYMIEFDSGKNVTSYVKISSELEYKYRLNSNMNLYAVFRKTAATEKGASVPECEADVYTDNGSLANTNVFTENIYPNTFNKKYRFNTLLNVYNCSDYDSTDENRITDAAVIYVKLGANDTYNLSTVKTGLSNFGTSGTVTTTNGTANYQSYSYKVGTDVSLTAKNRLQFVLNLTDSQVSTGNYKNVLVFTAFKTNNSNDWVISDNCMNYKNGKANLVMIPNS